MRILRRRGLCLLVLGLAHATLLMAGDIVGYYGLLSLVLGWLFLRRSPRALNWWLGIATAQLLLFSLGPLVAAAVRGDLGALGDAGAAPGSEAYAAGVGSWLEAAGTRLTTGLFVTFVAAPLSLLGGAYLIFLLGFWAARRRVLEEPGRHLSLLRWTAVLGIAVGWLGGLPAALAHVGALDVPDAAQSETGALTMLRDLTGNAAGLGYVAALALFAHWWRARPGRRGGRAVAAVAAVGRRSLSCYLAHSLLFAPALSAWGLGLGAHLSSAGAAAFAVGVWLVTVAGADALERRDRPGPVEAAVRRVAYRRRAPAAASPPGARPAG